MNGLDSNPPSSQARPKGPPILIDPSGAAVKVFVDPNSILNRTKLLRVLRSTGAEICHQVPDASVLVVNTGAVSGKRFVRDWGSDPHKTVVEYGWIQECADRRKALLADDDWGGFRAVDDGGSIHSDDDEEDDGAKSALPTPRPTPQMNPIRPSSRRSRPAPTPSRSRDGIPPLAPLSAGPPAPNPAFPPSSQPPPQELPSFATNSFSPYASQSNGVNTSFTPQMQFSVPNSYMTSNMHGLPSPFLMQPHFPFPSFTALLETAIAVGRAQNYDTTPLQTYLATLPHVPRPQTPTQGPYPSSQPIQPTSQPVPTVKPSTPDTDDNAHSSSRPSSKSAKQKGKARTSDIHSSRPPVSTASSKPRSRADHSNVPVASSSKQAPSTSSAPRRGIFMTSLGESIPIFVQVDCRNRHDVVQAIKKAGGKITPEIQQARYAILNPRSTSYPELKRQAETHSRPMVQASFVHDCIEDNELLDPADYAVEETSSPQKRKVSGSFINNYQRKPILDEERTQTPPPKVHRTSRSPQPPGAPDGSSDRGRGKVYTKEEKDYVRTYYQYLLQSEPYMSRTAFANKLYRKMPYRPEKGWYAHLTNIKETLEAIKAEAHPSSSGTHTEQVASPPDENGDEEEQDGGAQNGDPPDDEQDEEEATRAKRRRMDDDKPTADDPFHAAEEMEEEQDVEANLEASAPRSSSPHKDVPMDVAGGSDPVAQQDFERAVEFLASDEADDGGDDIVWTRLAQRYACQSAEDWPTFVDNHLGAITPLLEEIIERRRQQQQVDETQAMVTTDQTL